MTCDTCPATLSPGEHRAGRRRCRACCKAMPRILPVKRGGWGHAHVSTEWAKPVGKAAKKPKAQPGVSWWLDFASGPRRDEEFMAKADRLVPRQTAT